MYYSPLADISDIKLGRNVARAFINYYRLQGIIPDKVVPIATMRPHSSLHDVIKPFRSTYRLKSPKQRSSRGSGGSDSDKYPVRQIAPCGNTGTRSDVMNAGKLNERQLQKASDSSPLLSGRLSKMSITGINAPAQVKVRCRKSL